MIPDRKKFAAAWIDAWNAHDLDRILRHYAEDVEVTTPMIKVVLNVEDGTVRGKAALRDYWAAAFEKVPDLQFELLADTEGVDSIALYYKSVMGKVAIETMFFDGEGKVSKMVAHYD